MLSLRLFRPGVPQGREEKAYLSIKWRIHLIEGAVQQPRLRRYPAMPRYFLISAIYFSPTGDIALPFRVRNPISMALPAPASR